jgi:type II secretory pathway pseudopilin PulG
MNPQISESVASSQRRVAFTLIELLVVIGTIVLLSAVLLPALAGTKPNTIVAQCLENQRRLAQAFVLYTADYHGTIVPSGQMDGFIQPMAINWNVTGESSGVSLQNFQTTVNSATNFLYAYGANSDVIHCPGDVRYRNTPGAGWAYDSYSKTDNVRGKGSGFIWGQSAASYTNLSQIANPAHTFAFQEDVSTRGYNQGTWTVNWNLNTPQFGHAESFTWADPIPMYHGDVTTAACVDGHAEFHKWTDRTLIQYGLLIAGGGTFSPPNPPNSGPDYEFIYQNYRFPGWQP